MCSYKNVLYAEIQGTIVIKGMAQVSLLKHPIEMNSLYRASLEKVMESWSFHLAISLHFYKANAYGA